MSLVVLLVIVVVMQTHHLAHQVRRVLKVLLRHH